MEKNVNDLVSRSRTRDRLDERDSENDAGIVIEHVFILCVVDENITKTRIYDRNFLRTHAIEEMKAFSFTITQITEIFIFILEDFFIAVNNEKM